MFGVVCRLKMEKTGGGLFTLVFTYENVELLLLRACFWVDKDTTEM